MLQHVCATTAGRGSNSSRTGDMESMPAVLQLYRPSVLTSPDTVAGDHIGYSSRAVRRVALQKRSGPSVDAQELLSATPTRLSLVCSENTLG